MQRGVEVEEEVRVGDEEREQRPADERGEPERRRAQVAGGGEREQDRQPGREQDEPRGVLEADRQAGGEARAEAPPPRRALGDPDRAEQDDRDRRERADVGHREPRERDRQEGEAEHRGGDEACAPVPELAADAVERGDAHQAEDRGQPARDLPDPRGARVVAADHLLAAPERERDHPVGEVQQVRVRGGVLEVAGVRVAEDLDRALGEVRALVDVEHIGQPVVVVEHAQHEPDDQHQAEHGKCRALGPQAAHHGGDGSFDPPEP